MSVLTVQYRSNALARACAMNVILPEDTTRASYPALYLLHGLSDDHTTWCRRTRIEWYVREMPLIVVMPDGGRGFYCDAVHGPAHERHILEDVIGWVDHFLPSIRAREGRAVGGLCTGGYGSMKLALKRPDLFCSVVSHSSCFLCAHRPVPDSRDEWQRIFGPGPGGGKDDVFALAENIDRGLLPAIRFDCGTEDGLLQDSREFHQHLTRLGIEHEYEESPGAHSWDFWDLHVQEALRFHWRTLATA